MIWVDWIISLVWNLIEWVLYRTLWTAADRVLAILQTRFNFLGTVDVNFLGINSFMDTIIIVIVAFLLIWYYIKKTKSTATISPFKTVLKVVIVIGLTYYMVAGDLSDGTKSQVITGNLYSQENVHSSMSLKEWWPTLQDQLRVGKIREALPTNDPSKYWEKWWADVKTTRTPWELLNYWDSGIEDMSSVNYDELLKDMFKNGEVKEFVKEAKDSDRQKEIRNQALQKIIIKTLEKEIKTTQEWLEFVNITISKEDGKLYEYNSFDPNQIDEDVFYLLNRQPKYWTLFKVDMTNSYRIELTTQIAPNQIYKLLYEDSDELAQKIIEEMKNSDDNIDGSFLYDSNSNWVNALKKDVLYPILWVKAQTSLKEEYTEYFDGFLNSTTSNNINITNFLISLNYKLWFLNREEENGDYVELYNTNEDKFYYTMPNVYRLVRQMEETGGSVKQGNAIGLNYINSSNLALLQEKEQKDHSYSVNLPLTIQKNSLYSEWYPETKISNTFSIPIITPLITGLFALMGFIFAIIGKLFIVVFIYDILKED